MTDLIIDNTIEVETEHGLCEIELCFGSVTKLKEKIDVLIISAFPGDYTPTRTSVIGALKRDLEISIRELAMNKEEDLRKLCSCWWSKKLDAKLPFDRIMCFEGGFKKNTRPPSTISEIFRSLVSLCGNEDITVMTPILATGNQGYSEQLILRLLVEATIHWMKIGLPLKKLKIVAYSPNPEKPSPTTKLLSGAFTELKKNWQLLKDHERFSSTQTFDYDVYLIYSEEDTACANTVIKSLLNIKDNVKIFNKQQEVHAEQSWQGHIYDVMVNCERVIAILSPTFLANVACIEKYNIALCCTHTKKRDYLAPLLIEEILQMPTYMGLIQYLDCRPVNNDSILAACNAISSSFSFEVASSRKNALKLKNSDKALSLDNQYDVFISYSHKDTNVANAIVEFMKKLEPNWNIFIDQSSLRAGSAWQKKLYTSIENSKVVLALLSYNYMESKVCQEEYNLARSLNDDGSYITRVIDLKLDVVDIWPIWCTPCYSFDITDEKITEQRVKQIINCIESTFVQRHVNEQNIINIKERTSIWRRQFYKQDYPVIQGESFVEKYIFSKCNYESNSKYDIVLSYHKADADFAKTLGDCLKTNIPNINISLPSDDKKMRLKEFDEAKIIVPLLSNAYVTCNELIEEFQIALCRHRFEKELILFPIIVEELPLFPVYPQIMLCFFSMEDSYWYTEYRCLKTAALVLCNILLKKPQVLSSFKTLLSMLELQEWCNYFVRDDETETLDLKPLYFTGGLNSSHNAFITYSNEDVPPDQNINHSEDLTPMTPIDKMKPGSDKITPELDKVTPESDKAISHESEEDPFKNKSEESVSLVKYMTQVKTVQINDVTVTHCYSPIELEPEENEYNGPIVVVDSSQQNSPKTSELDNSTILVTKEEKKVPSAKEVKTDKSKGATVCCIQ